MIIVTNQIIKEPVTLTSTFADVTEASTVQWYEYYRDICAIKITPLCESFGGIGRIVEIDKTSVRKRKFDGGRRVKEHWISSDPINILHRTLEYAMDHLKKNTFNALEIGKSRL